MKKSGKKSGQAQVLSPEQVEHLFEVIKDHRHAEKNTAIMQISFKLGLRVQEISLLQIKEVARVEACGTAFRLHDVMALPAAYTKGSDATGRSRSEYERKSLTFSVETFARVVKQIEALAKSGSEINPEMFYPDKKIHKGKSRDLPMVDGQLREALINHLNVRLSKDGVLRPTDSLFVSQKGTAYSPNTLQDHMSLMLRGWCGFEKATSHSGRRTVLTDIIHHQKKPLSIAQKIAGHASPATTVIYAEPPESEIMDALKDIGRMKG